MDWLQEEEMKTPRLKICPDCGGKMQKGRTKFITESDEGLIAIENLPEYIALEMRQTILVPLSSLYTLHSSGFQGQ